MIKAGVDAASWWATGFALLVGLLTLYSMIKIWSEVFWKKAGDTMDSQVASRALSQWAVLPVIMLATMTVSIGIWGEYLLQLAEKSAVQLLDRSGYINAVLGAGA